MLRRCNATLPSGCVTRLPPHCRFPLPEIPKRLGYSSQTINRHGQGLTPTAHCNLPDSHLYGGRYTLKLCRDPASLRPLVPIAPDFSLRPCCLTTTSSAYVSGLGSTFSSRPQRGFTPLHNQQGEHCYQCARVRVAQSHPIRAGGLGRRRGLHPPAPCVCRASSITSTRLRR